MKQFEQQMHEDNLLNRRRVIQKKSNPIPSDNGKGTDQKQKKDKNAA